MKTLSLVLALAVLSAAQKQHKHGKHGKQAYVASSPGSSHGQSGGQYQEEQPAYYGGSQSGNYGSGKSVVGAKHPQLLSDTRTLNTDGTINYNFQADNGLQQGETVDADGTRRGFYSYPGADGKTLTVKYTAGKNGFVAEGDHLPMQPQSAAHSEKDEAYVPKGRHGRQESNGGHYSPQSGSYSEDGGHEGGGQGGRPYSRPSHNPARSHYSGGSSSSGPSQGGSTHQSSPYSSQGGAGSTSYAGFGGDDFPQGFASPQTSYNDYAGIGGAAQGGSGGGRPHSGGAGQYSGGAGRFPGGSQSGSYSSSSSPGLGGGSPSYNSGAAPASFGGGHGAGSPGGGGFMYNAANPYQPTDGAGPFNGAFDLGNSGHFSINFNPGSAQAYQPGGEGGGAPGGQTSSQSYGGAPEGGASHGGGTRGQY